MASEKARLAKEQGNEAFKAGDYPTAIDHYTTAIIANSSDPIFFLNRAAAYLKLGETKDAERDCTKSLSLNPNNVKALFRRGQARRGLADFDGARKDLIRALELEPSNTSVKDELAEVDRMLKQEQTTQPRPAPKRRRVPIEIVEAESEQKNEPESRSVKDKASPLLSKDSKSESRQTTAELPPLSRPPDIKQPPESSKGVRVGGGIFRPGGNHTIVTRTQSQPVPREKRPVQTPSKQDIYTPMKPPTTLFDFTRSWISLNTDDARWELMCTIPPSSLPALFQASLEPDMLKSILWTLHQVLLGGDRDTRSAVRGYMLALMKVQRFGTVMLFMDEPERRLLELLRLEVESDVVKG